MVDDQHIFLVDGRVFLSCILLSFAENMLKLFPLVIKEYFWVVGES